MIGTRTIPAWMVIGLCAGAPLPAQEITASDTLDGPPPAVDPSTLRLGRDTIWAAPGEVYTAGGLKRVFLGDLNRDLWHLRFPVPVLDLDSVGGGLTVEELSGGKQTLGVRFLGADGLIYQFRSILKTASRAIPGPLRSTVVDDALQDQMAAQFPLSAMIVAELLEAAGVLVARPHPVIMPVDPRLGEFGEAFAGRMGWIEVRPNERETPDGEEYAGFAGSDKITGSDELYEELIDDPESYVDTRKLLRARLIDMLVGDWDRHSGQWRWASYPDGERTRWEPIPRDRDWALARIDGMLPRLTAIYMPKYTGFSAAPPDVLALHWSAQRVDRTLLSGLDRAAFEEVAAELTATLDDTVLDRAVALLPASYQEAVGPSLRRALGVRRDALPAVAEEYYELLAGWVDVPGTEETDSVHVVAERGGVRVTMLAPREGDFVRYDRWFDPNDTRDIRVYLRDGDDLVVAEGNLPITVRIVGASGDDRIVGSDTGPSLIVYESEGDDDIAVDEGATVIDRPLLRQDSLETGYFSWSPRDWGSSWVPRPELWYNSDIGIYAGLGLSRLGFGFGALPYHSRWSLAVLNGFDAGQWIVDSEFERALGPGGWRVTAKVQGRTDEPVWLTGADGVAALAESVDDLRFYRSSLRSRVGLRYRVSREWSVELGPEFTTSGAVRSPEIARDSLTFYGAGGFDRVALRAAAEIDTRDDRRYPTAGRTVAVVATAVPALLDAVESYSGLSGELVEYRSLGLPGEAVAHLRLTGEKRWGRTPFFERAHLGGSGSLPGFQSCRFVGDASAAATALVRFKLVDASVLTEVQLGLHGVATAGRVWHESAPTSWHTGAGGGLWLRIPAINRAAGLTLVRGDRDFRVYLDFGFLY